MIIWGFYSNITNYNFREQQKLELFQIYCQRGEIHRRCLKIKGFSEIIVGEVVVKY